MIRENILVFNESITGHHLEYINHLYLGALKDIHNDYFFLLTPDFEVAKEKLSWPNAIHIRIIYIYDKDIRNLNKKSGFFKSLVFCRIVKKAIIQYEINRVFLISIMSFMPFIIFFINGKVKVSGIVYLIYLYRWKESTLIIKILDSIKYFIFSNFKFFDKIFLLNDNIAPIYLNKIFKTTVFNYLPDPFIKRDLSKVKCLRNTLNISSSSFVFLHFGALDERKGTLEILKAISVCESDVLKRCCFIFAGKIMNDIREPFFHLYNKVKNQTQIFLYDEFCDYYFISSLCLTSNFILIPYKNTQQSSGVIGYGAEFNIPVVGPNEGLLGKLIKRNKLGFLLEENNYKGIVNFIRTVENKKYTIKSEYIINRSISNFQQAII